MSIEASAAIGVTVITAPPNAVASAPIPVVVVPAPAGAMIGRARRVVVVPGGGPVVARTPLPVYDAGAGALYTDDPPMAVYVVSGLLGSVAPAPSALLNGLAAYLRLDEAGGVAIDSGSNGLTFADNNTVTSAAGRVGGARQFTAANSEWLSCADNAALNPTTAASWVFWIKPTTIAGAQAIAAKWTHQTDASWSLRQGSGGAILTYIATTPTDPASTSANTADGMLIAGTFTHVGIVFDGNGANNAARLKMYINGTSVGLSYAGTMPATLLVSGATLNIGLWGGSVTNYLNGAVDEFGLWGRAITAAEIAALYNGGAGRAYPFVGA